MRVLVLGADGYIGFPLCVHLAKRGFHVLGVDKFLRRKWVAEVGSHSATPIRPMSERLRIFRETSGKNISFRYGDLRDYDFVTHVLSEFRPEVIVHLGELPSAPFSMIDVDHAVLTQTNNLVGTLNILYAMKNLAPDCHLIKLGSMGEYGASNIDIPEGFFDVEYRGRKDTLMFPRQAFTDWYHWSKVYDSGNIMMACKIWDLRSTDIMQGVVYGTRTDDMLNDALLTRFDFDAVFGTVLNRFCAQAVLGHKLTCYGSGNQKRAVIALRDTIICLALVIGNPPARREYRVFNQFDEIYSVSAMAEKVRSVANRLGLATEVEYRQNPRIEEEKMPYYNPVHEKLYQLGFRATHNLEEELEIMLADLSKYRGRLMAKAEHVLPRIHWGVNKPGAGIKIKDAVGA
ncbi:MAG: NAD-dependent epimerase/dehydratase family protein [Chloroflexota bacterium]